jgi:hypothetical protein
MTHAEQIRKALELLAPPRNRHEECRRDIEFALDRVNGQAPIAFKVFGSKQGKAGLRRYASALRQVRAAFQNLDPAIRPWFSLSEIAHVAGAATHIDREIAKAEALLERRSSSSRASQHKAAVAASYDLLSWWGRRIAATRGGEWAQLAGILAGDQAVDLFDLLRAHKRSGGPTVEKLRGEHSVLYRLVPRDGN